MTGGGPRAPFRVESEMVEHFEQRVVAKGPEKETGRSPHDAWSRRKIPSERRRPRERWTGVVVIEAMKGGK